MAVRTVWQGGTDQVPVAACLPTHHPPAAVRLAAGQGCKVHGPCHQLLPERLDLGQSLLLAPGHHLLLPAGGPPAAAVLHQQVAGPHPAGARGRCGRRAGGGPGRGALAAAALQFESLWAAAKGKDAAAPQLRGLVGGDGLAVDGGARSLHGGAGGRRAGALVGHAGQVDEVWEARHRAITSRCS